MKRRIFTCLLAVSLLLVFAVAPVIAADLTEEPILIRPISLPVEVPSEVDFSKPFYLGVTGEVKTIDDYRAIPGAKIISLVNKGASVLPGEDPGESRMIISPNTYILDDAEIMVGDIITGFYDASRPMIMIYPPQYNPEVVVVETDKYNVKFDIFDQNLVSMDNSLKLNVGEETEIVTSRGEVFTGQLTDRKLLVLYGASTKSIPAQTTPLKIIVLPRTGEKDIVVNNKVITAPAAYDYGYGVIMVPLRAIAEALGYEVSWDGEERSVNVGSEVSLKIGENIEQFGISPSLKDGHTYVPLHFFTSMLGVDQAAEWTEQIVINRLGNF
ncbi:MAG: copper amine oxidase N-terminal domain-containing protein [Peptococcia bacterium]